MLAKDAFLTLIRLGIETEDVSTVNFQSFCELTQEDWESVQVMADKQGVSAIVMDGLSQLVEKNGKEGIAPSIDSGWWQMYVLKGIGAMLQTEQINRQQIQVMESLASKWAEKGCKVMIFKGQASATMYPKPERRSPGDIDCYLFEDYAKGNEIAREEGAYIDESWYKHSTISYNGESFENHQFFVHTRDGKRGKQQEKELEEELKVDRSWITDKTNRLTENTIMPPIQWTAMFLTYHACAHFISEGLRLKQLLDWAMLLKNYQEKIDWSRFYAYCDRNHLRRFADAATSICVNHLGINITNPSVTIESPYADKILHSALYDNDYVFGSGEGSWHNRFHLIRNLFHYRWKYEEIYEESVWRQLWYYATGYLFKTE